MLNTLSFKFKVCCHCCSLLLFLMTIFDQISLALLVISTSISNLGLETSVYFKIQIFLQLTMSNFYKEKRFMTNQWFHGSNKFQNIYLFSLFTEEGMRVCNKMHHVNRNNLKAEKMPFLINI